MIENQKHRTLTSHSATSLQLSSSTPLNKGGKHMLKEVGVGERQKERKAMGQKEREMKKGKE